MRPSPDSNTIEPTPPGDGSSREAVEPDGPKPEASRRERLLEKETLSGDELPMLIAEPGPQTR